MPMTDTQYDELLAAIDRHGVSKPPAPVPVVQIDLAWSGRAFSIGLLVGGLFGCFFVVPFVSWMTGAAIFCFR